MGRVFVSTKMWNVADNPRVSAGEVTPKRVEAQVDTGAVRVVLPTKLARELGLEVRGKVRVRYADMRVAEREVAFGLMLDVLGRETETTAILEPRRQTPLIGQIILEDLDLLVDAKRCRVVPNPESPDVPLLDEFSL